ELPRGAPAQAGSCWLMMSMLIELSAEAATGPPRAVTMAMAAARQTARTGTAGMGDLTNREPRVDGRTRAAHPGGRAGRKPTVTVIQGGRPARSHIGDRKDARLH